MTRPKAPRIDNVRRLHYSRQCIMTAYNVLVNAHLLSAIGAFQRGIPQPLADFMRAHPFERNYDEAICGELVRKVIDARNPRMLQLLHRCYVMQWKHLKTQWPSDNYVGFQHIWLYAIKHGDDSIIAWLKTQPDLLASDGPKLLLSAIDIDNRGVIEWVLNRTEWKMKHTFRAAATGNVALFDWLVTTYPARRIPINKRVMDCAAVHGHLPLVKYLHENRTEGCTTKAMDGTSSIEVLQFLHEHRTEGCTTKAMDRAASTGRLDIVQFLHEHRSEGCSTDAMDMAAMRGDLDIIKYLHQHRLEGCSVHAINRAARNGHLEVVQFLVDKYPFVKASKRAIDEAAWSGSLDLVKYLHFHLPNACSTRAMDDAADRGRLDVVKFLHENRVEGCTENAMFFAVINGHLDVVRYLREHRGEDCSKSWMIYAAERGDLEMIKYLVTLPMPFSLVAVQRAATRARQTTVAEFLAELRRKSSS